jgi:TP901 family phage tail tape measure protein
MAEGDIKAGRAVWDLVSSHAMFTQGLKAAGGAMGAFATIVKSTQFIVGVAAAAMGVAIFKATQKAVAMAAVLDASLREVSTLIPETTEQLGFLRNALIDISTRVPQAPELLSAGVYQAISAGITDTTEALQVVEVSAKAAVAGLSDTFTAVDAITTVLNAYQLEASEAAHVSDILFKTVETGKVRFPELAQNIGTVVTSASLAEVAFEEVAAAIATVTKFGIGAAEATTSLNRAILSIIKPTKAQKEAAAELGIELNSAALAEKGLIGFVEELNRATEGQVDVLAKVFPNIRAFRSISILAGKGIDEYRRILLKTENSSGAANTAFQKMNDSLGAQSALLKNKINTLFQKLGAVILPPLVSALDTVNGILTTQEQRWREAAEAAGDYDAVLQHLREEQIKQLSERVEDLQKRLSLANQVFVSGLVRQQFGRGIVDEDLAARIEEIDKATINFVKDLESGIEAERKLIAEARLLRDIVSEQLGASHDLVGALNQRIVLREAELRDAELLLEVETQLGERARDRTAEEEQLLDTQRRLKRAREIAPDSDLVKILEKQERREKAIVELKAVQARLARTGLVTEKATLEELEGLLETGEALAEARRVGVQHARDAGILEGATLAGALIGVETQEERNKLIADEIELRKLLLGIVTKPEEEKFVANTKNLIAALTQLVILDGKQSLEGLAERYKAIAEIIEDMNFDNIIKQRFIDRLTSFVELAAEGLENLQDFELELPAGVELLTEEEMSRRMNLAGLRSELELISKLEFTVEEQAIAVAAAIHEWGIPLKELPEDLSELARTMGLLNVDLTETQQSMLDLVDDISFAINSALALADAFGASSSEVNTLIRNVDLLARSIERAIASGGFDFQSAAGAIAALLSIGANLIGVGETEEERRRREALEENTLAVTRLKQSLDRQIEALKGVRSTDFKAAAESLETIQELNQKFLAAGLDLRLVQSNEQAIRDLAGIDLDALERIAKALGIPLHVDDWLAFTDAVEKLNEQMRGLDLDILRNTFEGVQTWGQLVADVFDEELTPEAEFDLFRKAVEKIFDIDALAGLKKQIEALGSDLVGVVDFDRLAGDASDPETIQAWEDFSRFLVENFDALFRSGFFGGLTTDEAIALLQNIDNNTDALQELAAEADPGVQAVSAVNRITVEQADRLLALTSTGNFYLREIRDSTGIIAELLSGGGFEAGIEPPSQADLNGFARHGLAGKRPNIDTLNMEVAITVNEAISAQATAEAVVNEFDAMLGQTVIRQDAQTGKVHRRAI